MYFLLCLMFYVYVNCTDVERFCCHHHHHFIGHVRTQQRQSDFETLPARGVVRGLRTSNSLQPQTTVLTVCPQIQHPATQLPKPYLSANYPSTPWSCGSCGRQNQIFQGFHNRGNSPKPSVQLRAQRQRHKQQL